MGFPLAITNLAWPKDVPDRQVWPRLAELGFTGLELAPVKAFGGWPGAAHPAVAEFRAAAEGHGLSICALQGITFDVPDIALFGSAPARQALADHLCRVADLAAALGAKAAVFGAPRLRVPPAEMTAAGTEALAVGFFGDLAQAYAARGVALCLEPNPAAYGCGWMTETAAAAGFVARIASPGLRLQLDGGTIALNAEDPALLTDLAPLIGHAHASEPFLEPLQPAGARSPHPAIAAALRAGGYGGWVSVEMKPAEDWQAGLALAYAAGVSSYGG